MVIETDLNIIFWNTVSGLLQRLPDLIFWSIIIYISSKAFKILMKKLGDGFSNIIKNMPIWLDSYDQIKMKHHHIDTAVEGRNR
jgi:hypothetical protein